METNQSNIIELFRIVVKGEYDEKNTFNYKVKIPSFQRKYSWEEKDIIGLIEELDNVIYNIKKGRENKEIYLGHTIFELAKLEKTIAIIDGQQRITTFLLLLKILEEKYEEKYNDNKEELPKIKDYLYINRKEEIPTPRFEHQEFNRYIINEYVYLIPPENPELIHKKLNIEETYTEDWFAKKEKKEKREILKKYYEKTPKIRKDHFFNIVNNFNHLETYIDNKELEEERDLNAFIRDLSKFKVSYISTEDFDYAYDIFTSLNSKGRPLKDFDLIKSYCLSQLKKENNYTYDDAEEIWKDKIEGIINDSDVTNIFEWYITINCQEDSIESKKVFQKLKEYFDDSSVSMNALLQNINNYINVYKNCLEGSFSQNINSTKVRQEVVDNDKLIEMLFKSNYVASKPYILYLIDKMNHTRHNVENMIDVALWMPTVYVSLLKKRPESLMSLINKMKKDNFIDFPTKEEFLNIYFKDYLQDINDAKLLEKLKETISEKTSKYLLMLFEDNNLASKSSVIHLEHIYPKKPKKDLKEELQNKRIFNDGKFDEDIYNEFLNKLGNLTLVSDDINKKIKNKDLDYKVVEYDKEKNDIKSLNKFLKEYTKDKKSYFAFDDITKRTEEVAKDFQKLIKEKGLY